MINTRLNKLKDLMKQQGLDALIMPSNDPHQSEYVSDYWKIRPYFSGFSGSAGVLVISHKTTALWTDSRYFLQVEKECADSQVTLFKQSIPHAPEHVEWLCDSLDQNAVIGLDYRLFSAEQFQYLEKFSKAKNIEIKDVNAIIDQVWEDRPLEPNFDIIDHKVAFCGEDRDSKLEKIKAEINAENADFNFISSLDEIAWLLNIRSQDVDFTPLVTAYVLVGKQKTYLFSKEERFSEELINELKNSKVEILNYAELSIKLAELTEGKIVVTDDATLNYASKNAMKGKIIFKPSLAKNLKTIKNAIEIENTKNCMRKDGVAMVGFFQWLEQTLATKSVSEYEIGLKLESFRKQQENYKGQSFSVIAGYKGNGAIIHYSAPKEGSAMVSNQGMLLLDSGAQYLNGTTDITRTVWLGGVPSENQKNHFTLVLKGYISLETLRFPEKSNGVQLDSFARMHLWQQGLDYGHGTGHGIGSYSMVHEPNQGFTPSTVTERGRAPHLEGQLSTIEPGFYLENQYGIRTENVVVSKEVANAEFGKFLGFEPLTLFPIETQLIDFSMMTNLELKWLNDYHAKVYQELSPLLDEKSNQWLKKACQFIAK